MAQDIVKEEGKSTRLSATKRKTPWSFETATDTLGSAWSEDRKDQHLVRNVHRKHPQRQLHRDMRIQTASLGCCPSR